MAKVGIIPICCCTFRKWMFLIFLLCCRVMLLWRSVGDFRSLFQFWPLNRFGFLFRRRIWNRIVLRRRLRFSHNRSIFLFPSRFLILESVLPISGLTPCWWRWRRLCPGHRWWIGFFHVLAIIGIRRQGIECEHF